MRYDQFRDRLQNALGEAGLFVQHVDRAIETVDVARMSRRWRVYLWRSAQQSAEPFHVSAKVTFDWSPIESARADTCDLVHALLGRRQSLAMTNRRWVRIDLALHATLPYGSTAPMPDPDVFASWNDAIGKGLDGLLTEYKERRGRIVAVTGGREEVEAEVRVNAQGVFSLKGLSVSGFRIVRVPRVWDDPERRQAEKDIGEELADLSRRFADTLEQWTSKVTELARWIRYAPPGPEAKQIQPWFEDEDENSGPETIRFSKSTPDSMAPSTSSLTPKTPSKSLNFSDRS